MLKNKVRYALKDYYKELDYILDGFNYGVGNYLGNCYIYNKNVVKNSKTVIYCKYFELIESTSWDDDLTILALFNTKTAKDEIAKILIYDKSLSATLKENESLSGNKTKVCKKTAKKIIKKSKRY